MYPNPATTETNIMLDLDEGATVAFQVYDAIGRLVIHDEVYKEGSFTHTIKVDGLVPRHVHSTAEGWKYGNDQATDQKVIARIISKQRIPLRKRRDFLFGSKSLTDVIDMHRF